MTHPDVMPAEGSAITIAARGESDATASALHQLLTDAGVPVTLGTEVAVQGPRLGGGEVILTLLLTSAAKAVAKVALEHLEAYLRQVAAQHDPKLNDNLQVILVRAEDQQKQRFGCKLKGLTTEAAAEFVHQVRTGLERF